MDSWIIDIIDIVVVKLLLLLNQIIIIIIFLLVLLLLLLLLLLLNCYCYYVVAMTIFPGAPAKPRRLLGTHQCLGAGEPFQNEPSAFCGRAENLVRTGDFTIGKW